MAQHMNASLDINRRRFLSHMTTGLPGIALTQLLCDQVAASESNGIARGRQPHHAPRAKQVLQIFCPGGASHIDLWDHKPELYKYDGTPLPGAESEITYQGKNGNLMKSPWTFRPAGESG